MELETSNPSLMKNPLVNLLGKQKHNTNNNNKKMEHNHKTTGEAEFLHFILFYAITPLKLWALVHSIPTVLPSEVVIYLVTFQRNPMAWPLIFGSLQSFLIY